MFFRGKKEKDISYGALIDISSGSIGFSIVGSAPSAPVPHVIYSDRMPFRSGVSTENDTRKVREAMLTAALTIAGEGIQSLRAYAPESMVNQIFLTCSSPWAHTIAKSARYEADEPFKVTKKIIEDLIANAETEMLNSASSMDHLGKDLDIVERATVDVAVNGYPVSHPFQVKGKTLSLSHVVGILPENVLQTVHEIQEKLFPGAELRVHTSMLVAYCVLRDVLPKVHSSCIVSITANATEFGIVENDLLIANSFMGKGSTTLVNSLKIPLADIKTTLTETGVNTPLSLDDFQPFANTYMEDMIAHLGDVLEHRTLPEDIVILAHSPFGPLFKEIIRKAVKEVTGVVHTITCIDAEQFSVEMRTEGVHDHDVYQAGSARFFHKLHGCAEMHPGY